MNEKRRVVVWWTEGAFYTTFQSTDVGRLPTQRQTPTDMDAQLQKKSFPATFAVKAVADERKTSNLSTRTENRTWFLKRGG